MKLWRKIFPSLKKLYNAPAGVVEEMVNLFRESRYVWNK
jgi:hypothetical protein